MKTLDRIPTGKIERAGKLMKTGVKVGGNFMKYYGKKLVNPEHDKEELNEENASDIYNGLKSLKGSALKVAQMLSMEKNL
ncbi:MAG: AarF/ABC1/UbiB kinase family protein, partial [Eudoraea sp.]